MASHTLISSRGVFTAEEGIPKGSRDGCSYFPDHSNPRDTPPSVLMMALSRRGEGRKPPGHSLKHFLHKAQPVFLPVAHANPTSKGGTLSSHPGRAEPANTSVQATLQS